MPHAISGVGGRYGGPQTLTHPLRLSLTLAGGTLDLDELEDIIKEVDSHMGR